MGKEMDMMAQLLAFKCMAYILEQPEFYMYYQSIIPEFTPDKDTLVPEDALMTILSNSTDLVKAVGRALIEQVTEVEKHASFDNWKDFLRDKGRL